MESKLKELKPVSLFEVKKIIKERKETSDLTYEQEQTLKHTDKFSLTEKQTKDLIAGLKEVDFLKENEVLLYEIVNLIPASKEQLMLMLPKGEVLSDDDVNTIVTLTSKLAAKFQ